MTVLVILVQESISFDISSIKNVDMSLSKGDLLKSFKSLHLSVVTNGSWLFLKRTLTVWKLFIGGCRRLCLRAWALIVYYGRKYKAETSGGRICVSAKYILTSFPYFPGDQIQHRWYIRHSLYLAQGKFFRKVERTYNVPMYVCMYVFSSYICRSKIKNRILLNSSSRKIFNIFTIANQNSDNASTEDRCPFCQHYNICIYGA